MMEQAHDPEMKIAERYFLGELTDTEAEAFEAHYFECSLCAEYVREEMLMTEAAREVAKEPQPKDEPQPANETQAKVISFPPRRWDWLSAAAAAVLAVILAVNIVVPPAPRITEPEIVRIQFSEDRSAAASEPVRGEMIHLEIDVPPIDTPRFAITILDDENELVDRGRFYPAERANESIPLVLTALPAGTYKVVIEGVSENGNRSFVASQPFEVRG